MRFMGGAFKAAHLFLVVQELPVGAIFAPVFHRLLDGRLR